MTYARRGPAPAHGDGPLKMSLPDGNDLQANIPSQGPAQAISRRGTPHLRLVPPAPPPRPRRLEVRISAAVGRAPHDRSRAIQLDERDVEQLVDFALRLEARR
jgi:hypothetical protein